MEYRQCAHSIQYVKIKKTLKTKQKLQIKIKIDIFNKKTNTKKLFDIQIQNSSLRTFINNIASKEEIIIKK